MTALGPLPVRVESKRVSPVSEASKQSPMPIADADSSRTAARAPAARASRPAADEPQRGQAPRSARTACAQAREPFGDDLSGHETPKSMLEAFLVTVVKLTGAQAGAVRTVAADGDSLRLVAAYGLPGEALASEALIGSCGVCTEALRGDGVQVADDPSRCGRLAADGSVAKSRTGTVAVPLEYKGRTVGVFTLFFEGVHNLRGDVIHLLRPVGQLFGLTLENARLERENLQASLLHERQTMAGEIHDSLAQSLAFVRMRMPLLKDAVAQQDTRRAQRYCGDIDEELGAANRRMRELITHSRAGMDAHGLRRALEQVAASFFDRTGITLDFDCRVDDFRLSADREVEVFHIVQEALANVRKHSGAKHARLRVARRGGELVLEVDDDGAGFPAVGAGGRLGARSSFGLKIMKERAESIGARISFGRASKRGARVTLRVPLAGVAARAHRPLEASRG